MSTETVERFRHVINSWEQHSGSNTELEHTKLKFWPDNPRVYSAIRGNGAAPTQEEIQEHLLKMEHVKALIHDIELNGGLIEPLIVRDGTLMWWKETAVLLLGGR